MTQGVTDWGAGALIQVLFGLSSDLTGFYIGLLSDDAGPAMDGSSAADLEPAGASYVRQSYGIGGSYWSYDSGFVVNVQEIAFPVAAEDWGRVADWGLLDALTLGNLYGWGELPAPVNVDTGWQVVIPAGGIGIGLTSLDETYSLI